MNKLTSNIIFMLLAVVLSGCSTVAVHSKDDVTPPAYAGTNVALTKTKKLWYNYDYYGEIMFTVFDVPFSFMADTLLYPIDVYRLNTNTEIKK